MTREQISLVESTWTRVAEIEERAAELFYGRLFELDPSVKPLFRGDLREQGKKLVAVLGHAVASLRRLEALLPTLRDLGRRHAGYGVTEAHYDTVGAALLWTLERGLGPSFTPEVRAAWASAYGLLASVMKAAATARAA
jgi:hemoglobin-like flavoprotein